MLLELELINALKSQNKNKIESIFKKIYESYYKLVYFCVGSYLSCREDIEDITQEVFLNFFNHLDSIKINGSIKYYLTTSAKNLSINYLKKNKKEIDINEILVKSDERHELLLDNIKKYLKNDELEIIIFYVFEGYSLKEISKIRNENPNTTKSKYRRALMKLKELLKGEC